MITSETTIFDELENSTDITIQPNEHTGDILQETPNPNITRIYFQNLNGLRWDKDGGKWPYICDAMAGINVDIACFAEINTNTNNYDVRQTMETIAQRQFHHNRLIVSTSKYPTTTSYKPGGTAIMACNSITSNVKSHTRDRMGRWASIRLETHSHRHLRIISAYQVCSDTHIGSNTAANQQKAQLIAEAATGRSLQRRSPREAFKLDLQAFISQCQTNGDDIILVGDFNEEINSEDHGMDNMATTCGLADLFAIRLGNPTLPATYQRGHKRIDYALISPTLLDHIHAAGYDPFGYRIPTDHRGMYIDFNTKAIFHHEKQHLAPLEKRDFTTKTPNAVRNYVTAKIKYLNDHNFFKRLERLGKSNLQDDILAETLDRDFQRAAHHAAHKCARRKSTPWSPKLAEAWAELHFFRTARTAVTLQINLDETLNKIQQKWPTTPRNIPKDDTTIRAGYEKALQKLKQVRQIAATLREEYLQSHMAKYEALDEKQKAQILHRMLRAESQKKVFKKIRYLRTQDHGELGLTAVKIPRDTTHTNPSSMKDLPDTPDHWETVTIPTEIEQRLMERNRSHFGQAEGTPFTKEPLQADIGYKADGYAAELILKGQLNYSIGDDTTELLIKHLQKQTTSTLEGTLSEEDVLRKLKHWKESTSTSPSGLHLGHYHCMWKDPHITNDASAKKQVQEGQHQLLHATVTLLNYALRFGYTYQRWTKVVNVMLQKDKGNPRIHRLRVIHIYEADYNLLLAVKWRQATHHAEDNKLLNEGLYGSRPGRSAHDPALIEVLQHEIYRMSMKPGINFDLDATACYDRILTSLASICSRRVGIASSVALVNASTLEEAQYHLKTSLGISEHSYQHCDTTPIHGTGQGSGNSPSIWCFICSALFDAFQSKAHGATFTSYDNTQSITMYMIGFVDDCAQRVNKFNQADQPNAQTLITLMEKDAQLWNDLLWASGGALEQSKCSYHLVQTSWNTDGHPFLTGGVLGLPITLSHNGTATPTHQKSNYESHKTLGCYINPAQCINKAWKMISKKNIKIAQLLETNYFTRQESWTLYTSVYLPSITYPLPITPLTKMQCDNLDTRFLRCLLPRYGYNRNMARAIRYAPIAIGGAGFKQLYVEQGALLTQQIYKFLNLPSSQIGQMLRITMSWTQAFLGTSKPFLTDVNQPIPPIGSSILLDLRMFLSEIKGKIIVTDYNISTPLRENDRFIMDIALNQTRWSIKQMRQINSCRRYLQSQTLADITNMLGTRLLPHVTQATNLPDPNTIKTSRFNQIRPSPQAWTTWKKFLMTISNRNGLLTVPLKNWTTDYSQLRHWPPHLYDPTTDQIFSHYTGQWYREHQCTATGLFNTQPTGPAQKARGYPSFAFETNGSLKAIRNFNISQTTVLRPYITRATLFQDLQPWEEDLISTCHLLTNINDIQVQILNGNIVSCSDGSATSKSGTFGLIIATTNGRRLLTGNGIATGARPNSFRSEAYGVLATIRILYRIMKDIKVTQPTQIIHRLDNQSVIKRIIQTHQAAYETANQKLQSEQDVIDEINQSLHEIPITIDFQWIKGHQDLETPYEQLPVLAQLNCDADNEAARALQTNQNHPTTVTPLPHTPCQLIIQGQSVTSNIKRRVHEAAQAPKLQEYVTTKFKWSETTYALVDWELFRATIRKYREQWTTIVKHIHNISPTGHIAHRNNRHLPHECPACSHPYENNMHVITCPHPTRAQWRNTSIHQVRKHLKKESDPSLIDILQDGLIRVHRELPNIVPTSYPDRYTPLISTQNDIGWDQLYKGRWSTEWSITHDRFNQNQPNNTHKISGKTWTLSFARLLINRWLTLWHLRNEQRHGEDEAQRQQIRKKVTIDSLKELYSLRTKVCPVDRTIFYNTIEEHIAHHQSTNAIENWIQTHREAILNSAQQANTLGIRRNRAINEYLTYNPIPQEGE